MTEVNIPDEAKALGVHWWDGNNHEAFEMDGVRLILAAELDGLAEFFEAAAATKEARFDIQQGEVTAAGAEWDEDPLCQNLAGYSGAYGNAARRLRRRAAELRGEG